MIFPDRFSLTSTLFRIDSTIAITRPRPVGREIFVPRTILCLRCEFECRNLTIRANERDRRMLKLQDLIAHEKQLMSVIEHAQKELDAIRLLIAGMRLRSQGEATSRTAPPTNGNRSLAAEVARFAKEHKERWFVGSEVTNWLMETGIRPTDKRANLRATVANYLKNLYEKGDLERRNVGVGGTPKYEYRKREDQGLKFDQ